MLHRRHLRQDLMLHRRHLHQDLMLHRRHLHQDPRLPLQLEPLLEHQGLAHQSQPQHFPVNPHLLITQEHHRHHQDQVLNYPQQLLLSQFHHHLQLNLEHPHHLVLNPSPLLLEPFLQLHHQLQAQVHQGHSFLNLVHRVQTYLAPWYFQCCFLGFLYHHPLTYQLISQGKLNHLHLA